MSTLTRPARLEDLPRLTAIYNYYVVNTPTTFDLEPFTVEQRREWFSHYSDTGRHRILVAERDGEIVGYTSTSRFHPRAAYETTVETTILCDPGATGAGFGTALYTALFEAIKVEDVHLIVALVTLRNEASCRIHERFGFRQAMVLPEAGRKFGRYWDVAWFIKQPD